MSAIFGGSKSKGQATSSNQAYGDVSKSLAPVMGQAQTGADAYAGLLSGDTSGFNMYKDIGGYDGMAEQGSRGITGNAAASGMLRSGSTGKALTSFGNNLQNSWLSQYMDKLKGQADMGFQAANSITGAGQTSTSTQSSKTKPGIGGFLGSMASAAAASDIRLKENIIKIGKLSNGLPVYQYNYINDNKPQVGVMAHEVEEVLPEAVLTMSNGYKAVDYGMLRKAL